MKTQKILNLALHATLRSGDLTNEELEHFFEEGGSLQSYEQQFPDRPPLCVLLHTALAYDKPVDKNLVQTLIKHKVDLNAKMAPHQLTALHFLTENNDAIDIIRILAKAGANINEVDKVGDTPLQKALQLGQTTVALVFLEHGASVTTCNQKKVTPLHEALRRNKPEMLLIQTLLQGGANPNAQDEYQRTPMHWAAAHANRVTLKLLMDYGGDILQADDEGQTPLLYALHNDNIETGQILLEHQTIDWHSPVEEGKPLLEVFANSYVLPLLQHFFLQEKIEHHTPSKTSAPRRL